MLTQREVDIHILEVREKHDEMYMKWGQDKQGERVDGTRGEVGAGQQLTEGAPPIPVGQFGEQIQGEVLQTP